MVGHPSGKEGSKQASWRTDPKQTGKSNCVGDIGSHVENMVSYMTGLRIKSLCARLDTFVPGRVLDDNATIMVEYQGEPRGFTWAEPSGDRLRQRTTGADFWDERDDSMVPGEPELPGGFPVG